MTLRFIDSSSVAPAADGPGRGSSSLLAEALVSFEQEFDADRPEAVVLTDASEAALAAALAALKLQIPVQATDVASGAGTGNGRLIARLAASYTPSA